MNSDLASVEDRIRKQAAKTFRKPIAEIIKSNLVRYIEFNASPEAEINSGDSKVGGIPHLLSKDQIPHYDGRALKFVAQFNCKELKSLSLFPNDGILSVFIDLNGTTDQFPDRRGQYAVLYCPTDNVEPRGTDNCVFDQVVEQRLIPVHTVAAPQYDSPLFQALDLSTEEQNELIDFNLGFIPDLIGDGGIYKLGEPTDTDALQNWIYQHLDWTNRDGVADFEKQLNINDEKKINDLQTEFVTIFSVLLDDFGFSDCWIHLGIHKNDLKEKKFDRVYAAYIFT